LTEFEIYISLGEIWQERSMKKMTHLLVLVGITFLIATPLHAGGSLSTPQIAPPGSGSFGIQKFQEKKEAPSFSLKALNGGQVSLADFKGKPILLAFWATWCPSCCEELPLLEKFSMGKRGELVILTLAIDGEKESKIQRIVKQGKITLPVLLDPKEKIARTYGVKFIPVAFLIDREGFVAGMILGERDWTVPEAWPSIKEFFSLR
jgi:peroxiredoxin